VRTFAVALLAAVLVLGAANALVEWLERRGLVDTFRGRDDFVRTVDEAPWADAGDGFYETTPYARRTMVPSRFRVDKQGAWRVFLLGESFMMGTPYAHQKDEVEKPGGIASWLRVALDEVLPGHAIEVVNAAAGGQVSDRVKEIAEIALGYQPDLLVVATCNNEGVLPLNDVTRALRTAGGFRMLTKWLAPSTAPEGRAYYSPADRDLEAVRANFRRNLDTIVTAAAARGVTVLLCTLPANLRYNDFHQGRFATGGWGSTNREDQLTGCALEGSLLVEQARHADALQVLGACDDVEALRWMGFALIALERWDEARTVLEQYLELVPRNRCRPSFNAVIRDVARHHPNVRLVDLEARAKAQAPYGVPGYEQFDDYCHMKWNGYADMADEILVALQRYQLLPSGGAPQRPRTDRETLRKRFGIVSDKDPSMAPGAVGPGLWR